MKKSFVFYTVWGAAVQNMTDAQAGALLKAVIAYQTDKTVRPDDAAVGFVFDLIRQKLDEDAAAYAEVCAQRAESGRLGGMKRAENMKQMQANATNSKQMLASASKSKQSQANQAEYDYEYEYKKKESKEKEKKRMYGAYKHVRLSDSELTRLDDEYGHELVKEAIRVVDEYCQTSGKKYKDYNLVLRNWGIDRARRGSQPKTNSFAAIKQNNYDFAQLERDLVENL